MQQCSVLVVAAIAVLLAFVVVEKAATLQAHTLSLGGRLRQRRDEVLEGGVVEVQRSLQQQNTR